MRTPKYKSFEMSKCAEENVSKAAAYFTMNWKMILGIAGAARMFLAKDCAFSTTSYIHFLHSLQCSSTVK